MPCWMLLLGGCGASTCVVCDVWCNARLPELGSAAGGWGGGRPCKQQALLLHEQLHHACPASQEG